MRLDKFTIKAQEALENAQKICEKYNHQEIDVPHLALSLLNDTDGIVLPILKKIGVNISYLEQLLKEEVEKKPKIYGVTGGQMYISPKLKEVLDAAEKEAVNFKDEFISTEHILLALESISSSVAEIFKRVGINREILLKALNEIRGETRVTDQTPEEKYQALKRYSIDLTEKQEKGS